MKAKKAQKLQIKSFTLKQLNPAKYNPRTISDEALEGSSNSLKRFGVVEPIIVNINRGRNVIVGGHQRHKALLKLNGENAEVDCITVDLDEVNEKLLNLSLNNPAIQGEFIDEIQAYIDNLCDELHDEQAVLDLRIEQLKGEIITNADKDEIEYKEEKIKPYNRTHILLSFEPVLLTKIFDHLEAIIKEEGVEYEQCSN